MTAADEKILRMCVATLLEEQAPEMPHHEIRRRCKMIETKDRTILYVDGVPAAEIYPMEVEIRTEPTKWTMIVTQKVRTL
jgi:hypothetical protein